MQLPGHQVSHLWLDVLQYRFGSFRSQNLSQIINITYILTVGPFLNSVSPLQ